MCGRKKIGKKSPQSVWRGENSVAKNRQIQSVANRAGRGYFSGFFKCGVDISVDFKLWRGVQNAVCGRLGKIKP